MAADGFSPFGGPLFFPDCSYADSACVLQPDRSSPVEKSAAPANPSPHGAAMRDSTASAQPQSETSPPHGTPPEGSSPAGSAQISAANPNLHEADVNPNTAIIPFVPPSETSPSASAENQAPRSYAEASIPKQTRPPPRFVTNLTTFNPVKRGNSTFLKMPEDLYQKRLAAFAFALIGRIFLPKLAKQRPLPDLKSELQHLFKIENDWSLNTLGKGFFSLKFSSQADQARAARFTTWRLKEGSFNIREWKPNFDPYKENTSVTQIWVRLFHLPEEYWDPDFLVGIFRAVGNVVKLDGSTAYGMVGHFARALVEVDLSFPLANYVTIEGLNTSFDVEFGFENLPLFCTFCRYIGHDVNDCRSRKKAETEQQPAEAPPDDKQVRRPRRRNRNRSRGRWMEKEQTDIPDKSTKDKGIATHNSFDALDTEEDGNEQPCSTSAGNEHPGSTSVRTLVPLSPEMEEALEQLKTKDFSVDNLMDEDSESGEDVENVQHEEIQHVTDKEGASIKEGIPKADSSSSSNLHFTEQGLKDLAKRIATLSGKPSTPPSGAAKVEKKLKTHYDTGTNVTAYAIEPGEEESIKAMHNVATEHWSKQIDDATAAGKPLDSSHHSS